MNMHTVSRRCAICSAIYQPATLHESCEARCANCGARHDWKPGGTAERPVWRCAICGGECPLTAQNPPASCVPMTCEARDGWNGEIACAAPSTTTLDGHRFCAAHARDLVS